MPGYISKALQRFAHEPPQRRQNSPHQHIAPTYRAKAQYVEVESPSSLLDKEGKTYVQAVTGTLLYYARAVNPTMLVLGDVHTITGMRGWTDGGLSHAVVRNSIESLTSKR